MSLNGRIPNSELSPIIGGRLRKDAARAWNAMNAESQRLFNVTLRPTGSMSSYRTIDQQWYLWNLYKTGRGNLAAYPGQSNHGWGLAVDVATPQMRSIIDRIGAKYGYAKRWSDAQSEWWHIKWREGNYPAVRKNVERTLRPKAFGRAVLHLKKLMYHKGLRKFKVSSPFYGPTAVSIIKRFQKAHNLKPDGIVGPQTWAELKK